VIGRRELAAFAMVWVMGVSYVTGLAGVDQGLHWDEWYDVALVREAIEQRTMQRPPYHDELHLIYYGMYTVPSKLVVLWHAAEDIPFAIAEVLRAPQWPWDPDRYPTIVSMRTELLTFVETDQFKIETRRVYVTFAALAPLFVFLTVLNLRPKDYVAAVAAAALHALSFEVATHARWIAVDATQASMTALELWLLSRAFRPLSRLGAASTILLAGAAAGLVLSCKVTGVFAFLPVLVLPFTRRLQFPLLRERFALAACAFLLGCMVFDFITPGFVGDPFNLFHTIAQTRSDYSDTHLANAVDAPFEHAYRVGLYFTFFVGSPFRVVAALFAAIGVFGAWRLWRRHRLYAGLCVLFAAPLLAVLLNQPLMVVRNYIQLTPIYDIAFGMGVAGVLVRLRRWPRLAQGLVGLLALAFVANGASLAHAAWTIRHTTLETIQQDTVDYVAEQGYDIFVSPRLRSALGERLTARYDCDADRAEADDDTRVVIYYRDQDRRGWIANRVDLQERVFAPRVVNFHFHTLWRGRFEEQRTVVLPMQSADAMDLSTAGLRYCQPR